MESACSSIAETRLRCSAGLPPTSVRAGGRGALAAAEAQIADAMAVTAKGVALSLVADIAGLRADMHSHSATANALADLAHAVDRKRAKRNDDQLVADLSRMLAAAITRVPKSGPG
jgi:hypothetical protein